MGFSMIRGTGARVVGRLLLALAVLLVAACVPLPTDGGTAQPGAGATATPMPTEEIVIEASATAEIVPTGITTATIDSSLLITPAQAATITLPISPDHSIVGPVGEPQMHGTPVGNPTTNDSSN